MKKNKENISSLFFLFSCVAAPCITCFPFSFIHDTRGKDGANTRGYLVHVFLTKISPQLEPARPLTSGLRGGPDDPAWTRSGTWFGSH